MAAKMKRYRVSGVIRYSFNTLVSSSDRQAAMRLAKDLAEDGMLLREADFDYADIEECSTEHHFCAKPETSGDYRRVADTPSVQQLVEKCWCETCLDVHGPSEPHIGSINGAFHWRDGVYFNRLAEGDVALFKVGAFKFVIPVDEWASIVRHVSVSDELSAPADLLTRARQWLSEVRDVDGPVRFKNGRNLVTELVAALSSASRSRQEPENKDDTRVDKWDGRAG